MYTIELDKPITHTYFDGEKVEYTRLILAMYYSNASLGLALMPEEDDPSEELILTTNLEAMFAEDELVTIDVNSSTVKSLLPELTERGIIEPTAYSDIPSGFVTYPVYRVCDSDAVEQAFELFEQETQAEQ